MKNLITIDKDIVWGTPVFTGTRVPVHSLFDHLEDGISLDDFLSDFPGVPKEQAKALIAIASDIMTSKNLAKAYEIATRRESSRKTQNRFTQSRSLNGKKRRVEKL
ncbi:MAG: DUF433 domain-containing protein [Bacteroidota bacterium]